MEPTTVNTEASQRKDLGRLHYKDQYAAVLALKELQLLHPEYLISLKPTIGDLGKPQDSQMIILANQNAEGTIRTILNAPQISLLDYVSKPIAIPSGLQARIDAFSPPLIEQDVYKAFYFFHVMQRLDEQLVEFTGNESNDAMHEFQEAVKEKLRQKKQAAQQAYKENAHGMNRDNLFNAARMIIRQTVHHLAA